MKLQIMTRLGATCFAHHLRGDDQEDWRTQVQEIVRWFIDAVPTDIKGHTDTRIIIERDSKQVFQFTMDNYKDNGFREQEMARFIKSLADMWELILP